MTMNWEVGDNPKIKIWKVGFTLECRSMLYRGHMHGYKGSLIIYGFGGGRARGTSEIGRPEKGGSKF